MDKNEFEALLKGNDLEAKLKLIAKTNGMMIKACFHGEAPPDFVLVIKRPDGANVVADIGPEKIHDMLSTLVLAMESKDTEYTKSHVNLNS
jgi:hypothetical protein